MFVNAYICIFKIGIDMKKVVDIEHWNRKEHFEFFINFDEPFWGTTVNVDVTNVYKHSKESAASFFSAALYRILKALNEIQAFRLRIENNVLYEYDTIHASATIGREDNTFGFSFIEFIDDYTAFENGVKKEIARIKESTGLAMTDKTERFDTIHFSALPWLKFTSLSHARQFSYKDSVPKMSTGKIYSEGGKYFMPLSLHAHHSLIDGYHAGLFFKRLEELLYR
jgi:chloramphenicol O-acetyltransferase type A